MMSKLLSVLISMSIGLSALHAGQWCYGRTMEHLQCRRHWSSCNRTESDSWLL